MKLAWLVKNPVSWFWFWNQMDPFDYQKRISIRYKAFQFYHISAARGVGKTKTLEADIIRECLDNSEKKERELLFTTPNKAHLSPTMDRIILRIENDSFLKTQVERVLRAPDYLIQFKNKTVLHSRVAGFSGGKTFFGLHPDVVWIDEGQIFTTKPLEQLQGCFKTNTKIRVLGVPNDVRKSYLYRTLEEETFFKEKTITKFDRPDYTKQQDDFLARMYGGRSSFMYRTQVLAEWSKTFRDLAFAPRALDLISNFEYEDYKIVNLDFQADQKIDFEHLEVPEPISKTAPVIISADIAYSPSPTVIGLWNKTDKGALHLFGKYILNGVIYSQQTELFKFLINRFPGCWVAIDEGGAGKSVALDLINYEGPFTFVPVNFGKHVKLGETSDGKKITQRVKVWSSLKLEQAMIENMIKVPSSDYSLLDELHNSTRATAKDGTIIYPNEEDHHVDMLRCAIVAEILPQFEKQGGIFQFEMLEV